MAESLEMPQQQNWLLAATEEAKEGFLLADGRVGDNDEHCALVLHRFDTFPETGKVWVGSAVMILASWLISFSWSSVRVGGASLPSTWSMTDLYSSGCRLDLQWLSH